MAERRYSISQAGRLVGVENHVLRYWEDELHLEIPRDRKNQRYYTKLHIEMFQKINELKEKGYQLKAIEPVLKRMLAGEKNLDLNEVLRQNAAEILRQARLARTQMPDAQEAGTEPENVYCYAETPEHIIGNAIGQAMRQNNEALSEEISRQVNDRMVQELEYMMRISDEKEEERFKALDETLRAHQKENKGKAEAAAARMPFFRKKRFGRSGKKL